jgi:hypothetical protein
MACCANVRVGSGRQHWFDEMRRVDAALRIVLDL